MAEYDEFQEDGGDDANDAQGRGNNERREKALTLGGDESPSCVVGSPGNISFIPAGSVYIRVSYVYLHLVDIYIYFMVNIGTYIIHGSLWDFTSTVTINFAQVLTGHHTLSTTNSYSKYHRFRMVSDSSCLETGHVTTRALSPGPSLINGQG